MTRQDWFAIVAGLRAQLDDARRRGNDAERQGIAMALEQMLMLEPRDPEPEEGGRG